MNIARGGLNTFFVGNINKDSTQSVNLISQNYDSFGLTYDESVKTLNKFSKNNFTISQFFNTKYEDMLEENGIDDEEVFDDSMPDTMICTMQLYDGDGEYAGGIAIYTGLVTIAQAGEVKEKMEVVVNQ